MNVNFIVAMKKLIVVSVAVSVTATETMMSFFYNDFIAMKLASITLNIAIEFSRFGVRCKEVKCVFSELSIDSQTEF